MGEDGGAGGGGEFVGHIDLPYGDAPEDFGRGGGGEGEFSVGALDRAGPFHGNGGGDLTDPEVMDAGGGADEIDDRVDGAHLVEVDGFDRDAVKLGFGPGNALKHGEGGVAHLRGEFGFFQEITDFRPVAAVMMVVVVMMMVVVSVLLHEKAGAGQTSADGAFGPQVNLFGEVERTDGFLKQV